MPIIYDTTNTIEWINESGTCATSSALYERIPSELRREQDRRNVCTCCGSQGCRDPSCSSCPIHLPINFTAVSLDNITNDPLTQTGTQEFDLRCPCGRNNRCLVRIPRVSFPEPRTELPALDADVLSFYKYLMDECEDPYVKQLHDEYKKTGVIPEGYKN